MTQFELTEASAAPARFGELLRQHRLAAGLAQESLAERAGPSEHGIQKLESGATHPYRDTAERLIRALQRCRRGRAVDARRPRIDYEFNSGGLFYRQISWSGSLQVAAKSSLQGASGTCDAQNRFHSLVTHGELRQ
jgi:transcriptional regulator with XRE-family HTH domain